MASRRKGGNAKAKAAAVALASASLIVLPAAVGAMGVATAPQAAAFVLLPPDPARVLTLSFLPGGNNDDLGGVVCDSPRTCVSVPYPYLIRSAGVIDLNNKLLDGTTGKQIVFGYSQGARVASDWLSEYAGEEGNLSPDEVSFVLIGNPSRKYGGAHVGWGQVTPDTDYTVLDVSRQYDMASDYPDRFNLLAIANAYAGFAFVHENYEEVDLYDPANYVWTEGNTTYVFVPTENLPLLHPLRLLGLSALADALNGPLKAMIESAYDRSYLPAEPGFPPVEPEPEPEPEPEQPPAEPDPEPEQPPSEEALMASRQAVEEHHAVAPVAANTDVQPQTEPDSQENDLDDIDEDGATGSGQEDADEGDADPDADSGRDDRESEGDDGPASSQESDTQQKSSGSPDGDDAPERKERSDIGE